MGNDIKLRSFFIIQKAHIQSRKAHSFLLSAKKHKLQTRGSKDDSKRAAFRATTPADRHDSNTQWNLKREETFRIYSKSISGIGGKK